MMHGSSSVRIHYEGILNPPRESFSNTHLGSYLAFTSRRKSS
ncbi:hypothetical protein RSAG8_05432, partial [Rhizoctonia solani AG-8 WAC10335]